MFIHCQSVKEHVVLGTDSKVLSHGVYLINHTVTIDHHRATGGWEESSEDGHCGGLASSVVTQQCCDLTLVDLQLANVDYVH